MRILGLAHQAWPGLTPVSGADVYTSQLLEYMASRGHDVSIGVLGNRTCTISRNGTSVHMRRGAVACEDMVRGSDVIVTYLGATAWAKKFGKAFNIPVVQTIHNTNKYTIGFLGTGCDLAVYNSYWIQKHHDIARESRIIYDWVGPGHAVAVKRPPVKNWPAVIMRPPALREPTLGGNPDGKITLINALPNKGAQLFYEIAEATPEREFRVVRGGYEQTKEILRRDLPNVEIIDHQTDLTEVYKSTSVLLVPSDYESYGMVAVEAMSYGIPVIASTATGLQECLGWLGTYERRLDAFKASLEAAFVFYDQRSSEATIRYKQLYDQTKDDLVEFEQAMLGVANGWSHHYPSVRSDSRL